MPKSNFPEMKQQEEGRTIWIKDTQKAFIMARILLENKEDFVVQTCDDEQKVIPKTDTLRSNPKKFDGIDDLSALSNLNEATVLHNLQKRYDQKNIYTYSGLFLVAMNPFRDLGIYSHKFLDKYMNMKKTELPPHIFAVANEAYTSMLLNRKNQSLLITGESGAGKTENTKKVISFLAYIAQSKTTDDKMSIESKIIHTNPILEAFGNAQTVRNFNSSRFGKFIKIAFESGRITGATIEKYLLERSRLTKPNENERNFHFFYQLIKSNNLDLLKELKLKPDTKCYNILKNTPCNIPGIDDSLEFKKTLESMKILDFSDDTIGSIFRIIAAILHLGNIEFNEKNDKTEILNVDTVEVACELLSIPFTHFIKNILSPTSFLRKEALVRNRDSEQAKKVVDGFCRLLYENLFDEIIRIINISIRAPISDAFIGVLDIAGFEIFEKNDFEQFCINFTNEKLQQFFNHHMFILEQEIYQRERIEWNYIDFGHDLSPTINLIESNNPIGILAYVDEECLMPKGNEDSLIIKLVQRLDRARFTPFKFTRGFSLKHYAGETNYEINGWLEKNKEPFFENIFELIHNSGNEFVRQLVQRPTQLEKKGFFRTIAQKHKEQLSILMNELKKTNPHFIRCILPNNSKRFDLFENNFILHQLRCNGVLEGIRISRLGYPNRMSFFEFITRFQVIYKLYDDSVDEKEYIREMCKNLSISEKNYKIGLTKVFFKQGILAEMEEVREKKQFELMKEFKAQIKGYFIRRNMQTTEIKKAAIRELKSDFERHILLRKALWWRIYQICKPLTDISQSSELEIQQKKQLEDLKVKNEHLSTEVKKMTRNLQGREFERMQLQQQVEKDKVVVSQLHDLVAALRNENSKISEQIQNSSKLIEHLNSEMIANNKKFEDQADVLAKFTSENKVLSETIMDLEKTKNTLLIEHKNLSTDKKAIKARNHHLQSEMDALKVKNKGQLDNLIVEKDKKIIEYADKISSLKDEKTLLENDVSSTKVKLNEANAKLHSVQEHCELQKNQLENQKLRLKQRETELEKAYLEKTDIVNEKNKLIFSSENLKKNLEKMRCENEDLVVEMQKTDDEARKLQNELRELHRELSLRDDSFNVANEKIKNLEIQIRILKQENESLLISTPIAQNNEAETHLLTEKVKRLEKANQDLIARAKADKEIHAKMEMARSEMSKKIASEKHHEIEKLMKEVSAVNSERKALTLKIGTLQTENSNLKAIIAEKRENSESSSSNDQLSFAETERIIREELRTELEQKEHECMRFKTDLESLQERFDIELSDCHKTIGELKNTAAKNVNSKEIAALKDKLEMSQKSVSSFMKSFKETHQKRINTYRTEISELEEKHKALKVENSDIKRRIQETEIILKSETSKNENLQNSLDFYKKHSDDIANQLMQKGIENFNVENQLSELENRLSNMNISHEYQIKLQNERNEDLNKSLMEKTQKIDSLNKQIEKYSLDYQKLYSMIQESDEEKRLRSENSNLSKNLSDLTIHNETLKNDCKIFREKIESSNHAFSSLQSQMTALKKQNELINSQMTFRDREIKNWKSQCEHLETTLQELKSRKPELPEFEKYNASAQSEPVFDQKYNLIEFENSELKRKLDELVNNLANSRNEFLILKKNHYKLAKEKDSLELKKKQLERELVDERDQNRLFMDVRPKKNERVLKKQ